MGALMGAKEVSQQVATVVELSMRKAEGETHVDAMTRAVLELAEPDAEQQHAARAMTPQGSCHMLVQVAITGKRHHTGMWDKVRETSKWSRCQQISEPTYACVSYHFSYSCSYCPSCYTCCRS